MSTLISATLAKPLSRRRSLEADPLRRLGRLAARLQHALGSPSPQYVQMDNRIDRIAGRFEVFKRDYERHRNARRNGWSEASSRTREDLLDRLIDLRAAVIEAFSLHSESARQAGRPVSAWQILEELRSLEEFEDHQLDVKDGAIAVTTDPIVLEDLPLGRFQIVLNIGRLSSGCIDASLFSVEALDPNPPHGDESIIHPHVRDGAPCLGDATVPIQTALRQGRLNDAFRLVERVLQTYNPSSSYRSLSEWSHVTCDNCGDQVAPDESALCSACEQTLCCHCDAICQGCHESFCRGCVETTFDGEHSVCGQCAGHCTQCGAADLSSSLDDQDGLCRSCFDERESEEHAESGAEESASAVTSPASQ